MKLIMMMAMTADGMIARDPVHFPDWTSRADKRMFKRVTQAAGVIIMGSRTYRAIGKPLPGRLNVVYTRRPETFGHMPDLMLTAEDPGLLLKRLETKGYQNAVLAGGATINSLFLKHQLIDEMMLTVVPRIFGQGISLFAERTDTRLELIDAQAMEAMEPDLQLLHYRLLYRPLGNETGI